MKKVAITQDLCRMVELMLKGGAQQKEVGERLGISKATVSRIKTAGYDAEQYRKNTTERVEKENLAEETVSIPLAPGKVLRVDQNADGITVTEMEEEQVPGQLCMDLQTAEEQKPEMSDQTKLMRFLAGQIDKIDTRLRSLEAREQTTNMSILLKSDAITTGMDKLIDYLAQILRKMDG